MTADKQNVTMDFDTSSMPDIQKESGLSLKNLLQYAPVIFTMLALSLVILVVLGRMVVIQQKLLDATMEEYLDFMARDLQRPIGHVQEQMVTLAGQPGLISTPTDGLRELLANGMFYEDFYEGLAVLDENGRVLTSYAESNLSLVQEEGILPAFRPVSVLTWRLLVGEDDREPRLAVQVPVLATDGRLAGYLFAWGNLDFARLGLTATTIGQSGYSYLLDEETQTLLIVRGEELQVIQDLAAYPQAQAILKGAPKQIGGLLQLLAPPAYEGLYGEAVLRQETAVTPLSWRLIIEFPTTEAYAFFHQIVYLTLILFLFEIVIAFGISLFFTRRVLGPLRQLLAAATAVSAGNLDTNLVIKEPRELSLLGKTFNQMTAQIRELVDGLEQRVAERTHTLDRRTMQIQAAAQTARDATAAYDLDELLNRAVNLVPSRFGYYHAGIFLVDEQGEFAVLQAATGVVGQQMLAQQHKLRVGAEGIVGYVTQTGEPYITANTLEDAVYWPNPLLPETRSEMGLPLKVGDRIIGAMNVQSKELAAFEDEDITILQILTDQLAVAIEKTRLFAQNQARLEERLRTIVSNLPVILFSLDRHGVITVAEGQGLVVLGVATLNFVGRQVQEVFRAYPQILADIERALQGTAVDAVVTMRRTIWDVRYIPILNDVGEVLGVIGVANDISERTQAKASLQEKESQLRQIIDVVPQMIFAKDGHGRFLLANQATADAYQTSVAALTGTPQAQWHPQPGELERYLQDDREVLRTGRPKIIPEQRFTDADGHERVLQVTKIPFSWKGQGETAVLGVAIDITERKQADAALRQAQKLESLGVLAGGVAHDFNNLLVAILGQTSLALARLPTESPAYKAIGKAARAAERAADLTRQLLAYSGRGHFQVRLLNLNDLIQDNLHLFEVAVPKHVQLRSELAQDLPLVEADAGQMQQVIMNLILNGAEALGKKPGSVTVTTGVQTLRDSDLLMWHITGEPLSLGHYVVLEVMDNGQGMDKETVQRIFDPFFTTKHTGRGLGLAAVLGIVRGHRGGIRVYSEVGKGTVFKVLLPVADGNVPDPVEETAVPPTQPRGAHILVIDDEPPVRETIADMLNSAGFSVTLAADGQQGVALFAQDAHNIDLVLLDLSMPGMSGEETFQALRQIAPTVPILLSSGYNQTEATQRFVGQELAGFLQKPYTTEMLLAKVRGLIETEEMD